MAPGQAPRWCRGPTATFYGTTQAGGTNGNGTVFSMTTNGTLTMLLSFNGSDGSEPYGALVQAADGIFLRHDGKRRNQRRWHDIQNDDQRRR